MAENNRNWENQSYQQNQDWEENRRRFNQQNENRNQQNFGNKNMGNSDYNQNRGKGSEHGDVGYSGDSVHGQRMGDQGSYGNEQYRSSQQDYNRINYMPDNDQNRNYGQRDYENTQFGTSGTYGYRGNYGSDVNQSGYSGNENRGSYGNSMYSGNEYNQDWRFRNQNMGYGNDDRGYGYRDQGNYGGYGQMDPNRERQRNIYGGDTSNYGNANQGGFDRNWWERTKDKVSSWFGDDDAERRRRMDRQSGGGHRGKGPKDYRRSEDRIREDVCDRLTDDDMLDATNIQVQIQGDEVVLTGTVHNREEKRRAEDLVESISGVRNVENRLRVDRGSEEHRSRDYTGNTDQVGGIGRESGTTNEIIRNNGH